MAPGCERPRRVVAGPGGGWRPAVNGPGRLLRGLAGRMRSRCVPCTGACAPSPVPRLPSPAPRARARVHVLRVPRSAFCVPRPTPASSVFRTRAPHPRPRTLRPCPCPRLPRPAPRARARGSVFCVPRTVARVPRPVSPPALRGRSFRLLQAAGMKRKSGGSPQEPPDFACIAAARLTRACG